MSKQHWKIISGILGSLLTLFICVFGVLIFPGGTVGQITSIAQCSNVRTTDWGYQSLQSLIERYGILIRTACNGGNFRRNNVELRADVADWLATAFQNLQGISSGEVSRSDFLALERLYDQVLAEVEALEKARQQ